jgi:hypothetical protein
MLEIRKAIFNSYIHKSYKYIIKLMNSITCNN